MKQTLFDVYRGEPGSVSFVGSVRAQNVPEAQAKAAEKYGLALASVVIRKHGDTRGLPGLLHTAPSMIDGVAVRAAGRPMVWPKGLGKGETWVTLIPEDEDDERLWEFSLTTGKAIRTR